MSEDIVFTNLTKNIIQVCKERGFLRGAFERHASQCDWYYKDIGKFTLTAEELRAIADKLDDLNGVEESEE